MIKKHNDKTLIIGAGLTGLSTAYHLRGDYALFEKARIAGGMASSEKEGDFIFDKAGHLLHFKTRYAKGLVEKLINPNLLNKNHRHSWILSKGIYTRYPFQVNTYRLPPVVIKDCLLEMAHAQVSAVRGPKTADNLKDWILESFGHGIARHFMFPYNRKLWKTPLSGIGIDWVERFIPRPKLDYAIRGAVSDYKKGFGYNRIFYYPARGGMQALSDAFCAALKNKIFFDREIKTIDISKREIGFAGGARARFGALVSSIPLPELVAMIKIVPRALRVCARGLKFVSVLNLNLGIDRKGISAKHWIYFPENKYIFYRVGFFSNFSGGLCPPGTSSLYAEISYTDDRPLMMCDGDIKARVIRDLKKAGILAKDDKIVYEKLYRIKYAYPVCRKDGLVKNIDDFLRAREIYSIGRYGGWKYMSMEECILNGRMTADCINKNRQKV
ncbi:MAG: FAD-dependent oxidoreductase [Candidatus Omnitrophota bacterium]